MSLHVCGWCWRTVWVDCFSKNLETHIWSTQSSQVTFKMFRWLPHLCSFQLFVLCWKAPQGNFKSYHMPLNYFVRQFSKAVPPSLGVFGWKAALGDVWTCLRRRWARSRALSGGAVSTMSSKWAEINLQNCTLFCISRAQKGHVNNKMNSI